MLNRAPAGPVKDFVEELLPELERLNLRVLENRTGLVMLPATDAAQGVDFHLGEVLVSEAWVSLSSPGGQTVQGYTARLGRDLETALAVAVLDAALAAGVATAAIRGFVEGQARALEAGDAALLGLVEATRVEMETF